LREECVEETAEVDVGVGELTLYAWEGEEFMAEVGLGVIAGVFSHGYWYVGSLEEAEVLEHIWAVVEAKLCKCFCVVLGHTVVDKGSQSADSRIETWVVSKFTVK
jgi:hypothetical protein